MREEKGQENRGRGDDVGRRVASTMGCWNFDSLIGHCHGDCARSNVIRYGGRRQSCSHNVTRNGSATYRESYIECVLYGAVHWVCHHVSRSAVCRTLAGLAVWFWEIRLFPVLYSSWTCGTFLRSAWTAVQCIYSSLRV